MKKLILLVGCGLLLFVGCGKKECGKACKKTCCVKEQVVATAHSSKNALDWNGAYSGVLPCADCSGIETKITLNANGTFEKIEKYVKKENKTVESKGTFSWDKTGSIITLKDEKGVTEHYKVGEGKLIMLNNEGKEVSGELANEYILSKVDVAE